MTNRGVGVCCGLRGLFFFRRPVGDGKEAFTLIELLVVGAITALLAALMLPSFAKARAQAKVVLCASNLHQVGLSIVGYANDQGVIPFGPDVQALAPYLEPNDGGLATNQIWTGPQQPMKHKMALGLLLNRSLNIPEMMYCPGDDSNDPQEELDKIRLEKIAPAYSSYLYRQLDETGGTGRLEGLGRNGAGGRACALALDINSLISVDPSFRRTNHKARRVNVLYTDAAVQTRENRDARFAIRDQDLADSAARRDEILRLADACRSEAGACPGRRLQTCRMYGPRVR